MVEKQVDKNHYQFSKYINKRRWISIWHQLDEVISLNPKSVLEVGKGSGLFQIISANIGIAVETVDIDPELNPDHVASATELPFDDNTYDCVCAFQVLEHLPYEQAIKAFGEMVRVAKNYIIISLPDAKPLILFYVSLPKIGKRFFQMPIPQVISRTHKYDGEHFWEINKRGYPLRKIINDFISNEAKLLNTYRIKEYPRHRYFVIKKTTKCEF